MMRLAPSSNQSPDVEKELGAARVRGTRIVAWLILFSKVLSLASAFMAKNTPDDIRQTFFAVRIPDFLANLLIVLAIQLSSPISPILRLALLYSVTLVVIVESTFVQPLSGWAFSWAVFAATLGSLIAFDPTKERVYGHIAIGGVLLLSMVGLILQPRLSFIPPNPIAHGMARFSFVTLVIGGTGYFILRHYRKLIQEAIQRSKDLAQALEKQQALSEEAIQQKALAEERRREAEAALAEITRLREIEAQRSEQQRLLMRYETLMRESYALPMEGFAHRLLEALSEDLSLLGGLLYKRDETQWQVISTYAFPLEMSRTLRSGVLDMVAELHRPYLLSPAPAGTKKPISSLHAAQPVAVLYLPLHSEATGETLAIVELLLSELPSSDSLAFMEGVLPRIGTYLWMRMSRQASA